MKSFLVCLIFSLLFLNSTSILTEEQRQHFLKKLTIEIKSEDLDGNLDSIKHFLLNAEDVGDEHGISYDKEIIDKIRQNLSFPEYFNFLEQYEISPKIKNQRSCGSCWSHSSTTALAYRFKKAYGKTVDLSPQDGISCYWKACEGNTILDAQLNLIRNGTLTEGCFPFVSSDGKTIPKCPTECEDGEEFVKYKAKNAFITRDYYSKETFYEIVVLIMDQLISFGPVVSAVTSYEDFETLSKYGDQCKNIIYRYDGYSADHGGHAVTIVGYGLEGDRYYWIVQNSWGEEYCNKGFVKVEFGQIGIEQVSFAEAYLPKESAKPKDIKISYHHIESNCELFFSDETPTENWNNPFEINFVNTDKTKDDTFKYICGKVKNIEDEPFLKCYFEELKDPNIGIYEFRDIKSLGTEYNFYSNGTFEGKTFEFFSFDTLRPRYEKRQTLFVSEKGSKIIFSHEPRKNKQIASKIVYDWANMRSFKNCQQFIFSKESIVSCELESDEVSYFKTTSSPNDFPILYQSFCGYIGSGTFVYRLNKDEYPVFRILKANMEDTRNINKNTEIIVKANVEGSISKFSGDQRFILFGYIKKDNTNVDVGFKCDLKKPAKVNTQHKIICKPNIGDEDYNIISIYLQPYIIPLYEGVPYEIIMTKNIRVIRGIDTFGEYLKIQMIFILVLFILF